MKDNLLINTAFSTNTLIPKVKHSKLPCHCHVAATSSTRHVIIHMSFLMTHFMNFKLIPITCPQGLRDPFIGYLITHTHTFFKNFNLEVSD